MEGRGFLRGGGGRAIAEGRRRLHQIRLGGEGESSSMDGRAEECETVVRPSRRREAAAAIPLFTCGDSRQVK